MPSHSQILRQYINDIETSLTGANELLVISKQIKKGTIIHAEHQHINVAKDGVEGWIESYEPALLKFDGWTYREDGFALVFNVLASQDPIPYTPPYQLQYSGTLAHLRWPNYYEAKKIKIIPLIDLPLYISYPYKTALFERLIKKI